jgi:hypothetical protein
MSEGAICMAGRTRESPRAARVASRAAEVHEAVAAVKLGKTMSRLLAATVLCYLTGSSPQEVRSWRASAG